MKNASSLPVFSTRSCVSKQTEEEERQKAARFSLNDVKENSETFSASTPLQKNHLSASFSSVSSDSKTATDPSSVHSLNRNNKIFNNTDFNTLEPIPEAPTEEEKDSTQAADEVVLFDEIFDEPPERLVSKGLELRVQTAVIFIATLLFGVVFWPLFTVGLSFSHGEHVINLLTSWEHMFPGFISASCGLLVLLVTLDVGYWGKTYDSWPRICGRVLVGINVFLFMCSALVSPIHFPAISIGVYFIASSIVMLVLKTSKPMSSLSNTMFIGIVSIGLMIVSLISLICWTVWVVGYENYWEDDVRVTFYTKLNCNLTYLPLTNNSTIQRLDPKACPAAFFMWISPIALFSWSFFVSCVLYIVLRSVKNTKERKSKKTRLLYLDRFSKFLIGFLILASLVVWIASGMAGNEVNLAFQVFVLGLLGMTFGLASIFMIVGVEQLKTNMAGLALVKRLRSSFDSDVVRALVLTLIFPIMVAVFPLSCLRQFGRRIFSFTKRFETVEESKLFTSLGMHHVYLVVKHWNWSSVLCKSIGWCLIFDFLQVCVSVAVNVFLSYVNTSFKAVDSATVNVLLFFILLALMMLPPTPGLPVYLACAVIGMPPLMDEGWNFYAAWCISMINAMMIKFASVFILQCAGHILGPRSPYIRSLALVNTEEMRAIKYVLWEEKKITIARVAILLGGPDWPLCVVSGMLNSSLWLNLVANITTIVVVVPVTFTGACLLRSSESSFWASAATMALAVSILVQGILMFSALYYITYILESKSKQIQSYEIDQKVRKLENDRLVKVKRRSIVSHWRVLPLMWKIVLLATFLMSLVASYTFGLFPDRCFVPFDLTDTIEDALNGDLANVVKVPLGWIAIAFMLWGCVVLLAMHFWVSWKARGLRKKNLTTEPETFVENNATQNQNENRDDGVPTSFSSKSIEVI